MQEPLRHIHRPLGGGTEGRFPKSESSAWRCLVHLARNRAGCMFPAMSSESYHEPIELLSDDTKNLHRAIVSLKEELEAVDWYQQRAEACTDSELKAVLLHNKNEEIEHAMMTLEWLRRKDPVFAGNIATYIHSKGPITEVEKATTGGGGHGGGGHGGGGHGGGGHGANASSPAASSLGIGSLKGRK